MPEEISSTPVIYKHLIDASEPFFVNRQAANVVEDYDHNRLPERQIKLTFDQLKQAQSQSEHALKQRFPDMSRDMVNEVLSFFYGPFMLRKGEFGEQLDTSEKTTSAFAQKTMVHNMFYASTGKADTVYVDKVFNTAVVHDNLARAFQERNVTANESGMMSFLGIAKVMKAMGGEVYLPGDVQEVQAWDVENGIDACGIFRNDMGSTIALLFDAKGQHYYPSNDRLRRRGKRIQADILGPQLVMRRALSDSLPSLKRFLREQQVNLVFKTKIIIPTDRSALMTMKDAYDKAAGDKVKTLRYFAQTSEEVEGRIADGLYKKMINLPVAF